MYKVLLFKIRRHLCKGLYSIHYKLKKSFYRNNHVSSKLIALKLHLNPFFFDTWGWGDSQARRNTWLYTAIKC